MTKSIRLKMIASLALLAITGCEMIYTTARSRKDAGPAGAGASDVQGNESGTAATCDAAPITQANESAIQCGTGACLWSRHSSPTSLEVPLSMEWLDAFVAASDGTTLLAGRFRGSLDVGGPPLVSASPATFIARYDKLGAPISRRAFGGKVQVKSVTTDKTGRLAITGSAIGQVNLGGKLLTADGNEGSAFVALFDPELKPLWVKLIPNTTARSETRADFDDSSSLIMSAQDENPTTMLPVIAIEKMDASGETRWSHVISGFDGPATHATSRNGDVFIAFAFTSIDIGTEHLTSKGGTDVLIMKLDTEGDTVWSKKIASANDETALDIRVDPFGNLVFVGNFDANELDLGGGVKLVNTYNNSQAVVVLLQASGEVAWGRMIGDVHWMPRNSITAAAQGDVILHGYLHKSMTLDPCTTGSEPQHHIWKLDCAGNLKGSVDIASLGKGVVAIEETYGVAAQQPGTISIAGVFHAETPSNQYKIDLGCGAMSIVEKESLFLAQFEF